MERWELEHKHKDGTKVWGDVALKPMRDAEGRFVGTQGVTRDITARKRAEKALRESEEKYRLVAYATSDIIYDFRSMTLFLPIFLRIAKRYWGTRQKRF